MINYYINDMSIGTNEFKDVIDGVSKNISIKKDDSHLYIQMWNSSARSKYDAGAELHIVFIGYDPENSNELYVIPSKVFENIDMLSNAGNIVKLSI